MKKNVHIVGGGACALMLACELDPQKFKVTLFEKNNQPGRKFLVAGEGGLNITHSEKAEVFIKRYSPYLFLEKAFLHFSNLDLVNWFSDLGVKTFVGSSGRVFPEKGMKPIEVLTTILAKIKKRGVSIRTSSVWEGFSDSNSLMISDKEGRYETDADVTVFCLGGASWPITGSAGDWRQFFEAKHIHTNDFGASNCAFRIEWPPAFINKIEGSPIKNCLIICGTNSQLGEVVLTKFGIEGSGIYPLSPHIRESLNNKGSAEIFVDLKPNLSSEKIIEKLKAEKRENTYTKHVMHQLNLSDTQVRLLKQFLSKEEFLDISSLAVHIKKFKLVIVGMGPIEEAISTVGGIDLKEIDENFELKKLKNNFVIGEMLDYDAPTGGYLLQSCFSMANYVAHFLNNRE
ncbi:MAG: NAD(P)-dependent oxidoreductase [bacterium]|nr:NAD(P)-dependent oxidoreductase [bacterium]